MEKEHQWIRATVTGDLIKAQALRLPHRHGRQGSGAGLGLRSNERIGDALLKE